MPFILNMSYRSTFYPGWGRRYPQPNEWRQGDRYPHPDEWDQYNHRDWGYKAPQKRSDFYRTTRPYPKSSQHHQSHIPELRDYGLYWRRWARIPRRPPQQPQPIRGKQQGTTKSKKSTQKQGKQPNKNRRGGKNKQTTDAQNEKFRALTKKLFELLRSFHHLEMVSIHTEVEPPSFLRLTRFLSGVVKPANITVETKALLEGNAKNWAYTTRLILQDHYIQFIEKESETLHETLTGNWDTALRVAAKWYKKRYPKKHMQEPIKKVEALLLSLGQMEGGVERGTEIEESTPVVTVEDFPPLPQTMEPSSPRAAIRERTPPPPPLSPFPITLPQRTPQPKRRISLQVSPARNPAIARPDKHPDLLEIQPDQGTQKTSTCVSVPQDKPYAREHIPHTVSPRVEAPVQSDTLRGSSLTVVEVHAIRESPFVGDVTGLDPLISLEEEPGEVEIPSLMDSPCSSLGVQVSGCLTPEPLLDQSNIPTGSPKGYKPVKHLRTIKKLVEWGLSIRKKYCILGDSNVGRINHHPFAEVQIDSYPGATFRHAENLINKAQVHVTVEKLILSFGLNHRGQKLKLTAIKEMQRALKAAKERFPNASIKIPLINFSRTLRGNEQTILDGLNMHISRNMSHLPLLPNSQFRVGEDQIHWTPDCARAMLQHWAGHLNLVAL